jgi:broad specificity phosphatase PhoE
MTSVVLILANPTPWDMEDRVVGNQSLPLTDAARLEIEQHVRALPPVSAVYRSKSNEACDQAARIVAAVSGVRLHDNADLSEVNLGLWQGLTRSELHRRYESTFPAWEENPLAVNPPDGEALPDAMHRLRRGIRRILRRQRGFAIAMALRPMAMQIVQSLLRGENAPALTGHLHNPSAVETMSVSDEALQPLIS